MDSLVHITQNVYPTYQMGMIQYWNTKQMRPINDNMK